MLHKTDLFAQCDKTLAGNWSKLGFAAALMVAAVSLVFGVLGMPVLFVVAQASMGIFSLVIGLLGLCCMYSLFFILFYGFFVLVIRIYKNDYVTAGFLFYGLRDWKRLFRAGCLYMAALFAASFVVAVPLIVAQLYVPDLFKLIPLGLLITVLSLVIGGILLALVFPFLFSVYYLYETQLTHTDNAVMPFLKKSRNEMKGKKFLLLILCVSYAKKELLYAICVLIGGQVLSFVKPASMFASMLGLAYYVLFYLVFIKAATLCTVFYFNVQTVHLEDPLQIADQESSA